MDYANRRRLKLLGHLRFVDLADADPELVRRVELPGYRARVERVALFDVAAFDWNCPQHITPRFTEAQVDAATQPLRDRIAELEARLAAARPPPDAAPGSARDPPRRRRVVSRPGNSCAFVACVP